MRRSGFLAVLLVFGLSAAAARAADCSLPGGWRISVASGSDATVVGDFNGDGHPDKAVVAQNTQSGKTGLLIRLSDERGSYNWKVLRVQPNRSPYRAYVKRLAPGKYDILCVYDNGACEMAEKPLSSKDPSLFYCENDQGSGCGMAMVFVWDRKEHKFKQGMYGD